MIDKREPILRDHPDLFAGIFGNANYPPESVRKLMAAVALIVVKDYFIDTAKITDPKKRRAAIRAKRSAEEYIFDRRSHAEWPLFSFGSVCRTLGIDPQFARRGIRRRSPDEIRGIVQRITFHRADYDDD